MLTCPRLLSCNRELKYKIVLVCVPKYSNMCTKNHYTAVPHFNSRCIAEHAEYTLLSTTVISRFQFLYILGFRILDLSGASRLRAQFLHTTTLATSLLEFTPWAQTRACLQCSLTLRGKTPPTLTSSAISSRLIAKSPIRRCQIQRFQNLGHHTTTPTRASKFEGDQVKCIK